MEDNERYRGGLCVSMWKAPPKVLYGLAKGIIDREIKWLELDKIKIWYVLKGGSIGQYLKTGKVIIGDTSESQKSD